MVSKIPIGMSAVGDMPLRMFFCLTFGEHITLCLSLNYNNENGDNVNII